VESMTFEYKYSVEGYITFTIKVNSGEFSGASSFCISGNSLKNTILSLRGMYNSLEGEYQMNDYDSDDFVLFEFLNLGHIRITGQVGGSHNQQYLRYQFNADQTFLDKIIINLKDMMVE